MVCRDETLIHSRGGAAMNASTRWRRSASLASRAAPVASALLLASTGCRLAQPRAQPCATVGNVESVLAPQTVVFFGEMHGTEQSPALVGAVLCHAAARHLAATLAVELDNAATGAIEAYLHSTGDSAARAALVANDVWHARPPDGRTSQAMLELLETTRALVHDGADIRALAFSRSARTGAARDSLMAMTVADVAASHPERVVIGLTGNVHSRISVGTSFDSTLRPMTYLIRARLPDRRVLGLNASYDTGSAWVCMSGANDPCGPHTIKGRMMVPAQSILLSPLQEGYDGLYGVGALTASKPVIP